MTYQKRIASLLGLALMLSLLTFSPDPSFAACKNFGAISGKHKLGSQVNGSSVTICAKAVIVIPARTAVIKKPVKLAQKPVPKTTEAKKAVFRRQQIVPLRQPVSKPIAKAKSSVKPKKVIKLKSKTTKIAASKTVSKASVKFAPAGVTAMVYPSAQLGVGQSAKFVSSALVHYKSGTLLGKATEVRFTPASTDWNFGSGVSGSGNSLTYSYDRQGNFKVQLKVKYSVSYRIRGAKKWIAEPDRIIVSDELFIKVLGAEVDEELATESKPRVLLVGESCLERPVSFGCN